LHDGVAVLPSGVCTRGQVESVVGPAGALDDGKVWRFWLTFAFEEEQERSGYMRSLSHLGRLALCGMICLLLLAVTITTTTGRGDPRRADHAAMLACWSDQLGSTVTNVGVLDFTAALRIDSGWYMPPNPVWLIGAAQFDGAWSPAGWEVADATPSDQGTLLIALNRRSLTNRLWLGISILAASDAELYVDLLGTNAMPVAINLAGNLLGTGSSSTNILISLPLADYPAVRVNSQCPWYCWRWMSNQPIRRSRERQQTRCHRSAGIRPAATFPRLTRDVWRPPTLTHPQRLKNGKASPMLHQAGRKLPGMCALPGAGTVIAVVRWLGMASTDRLPQ
jgi:hypothetical protein